MLLRVFKRLHSSSRAQQNLPRVRLGSRRVSSALRERRDSESQSNYDANNKPFHEPFPIKITADNEEEIINRLVSPLHDVTYEEQLRRKQIQCKNTLRYFSQELYRNGTPIRIDVNKMPCRLNPIVPAGQLYNYRNREEYSIWRGHDGKTETVGLMAFQFKKHGDNVAVEPRSSIISRQECQRLLHFLNLYIREHKDVPVCYDFSQNGGWRRFVIKITQDGQIMLIGFINPRNLTHKQLADEKEKFARYFENIAQEESLDLKSIHVQVCPGNHCSPRDAPYEVLFGSAFITETHGQYKSVIYPETRTRHITLDMENNFKFIRKVLKENYFDEETTETSKPTMLYTYCGNGDLAINLSDMFEQSIVITNNEHDYKSAKENMELNKIENVSLVYGAIEVVIAKVMDKYRRKGSEMLVFCDSPAGGINRNVLESLRASRHIDKVLFSTTNINNPTIIDNLIQLCERGPPGHPPAFAPVSADMFDCNPQGVRFETIISLERLSRTKDQ